MDKRVLQERMRKKQQQLRRRKMMKLGGDTGSGTGCSIYHKRRDSAYYK